jgi:hypothetical protein
MLTHLAVRSDVPNDALSQVMADGQDTGVPFSVTKVRRSFTWTVARRVGISFFPRPNSQKTDSVIVSLTSIVFGTKIAR